jgi:two-component system nitrogen regulation response regulator GlnG
MKAVWIVDDDQSIRWVLEKSLTRQAIPFKSFSNPDDVLDMLEKEKPQLIISDIRMPKGSGITLLQQIKQDYPKIPVIVMTAYSDMDSAVAAFQGGAFEYITKPFDIADLMELIQRAISESMSAEQIKTQFAPQVAAKNSAVPELIGQAPAMQEVFRAIGRLAQSNATVLITGDSGTGKELVARALHRHSTRVSGPFVEMNLAATPKELIEAELFGYERGAFANATARRRGNFELADGGTLFLDEIADMPLESQSSLLRLLEDGKFYRIGGQELLSANVRIVASSNQNLEMLVSKGSFRQDLFHRLNVIRLTLPALRERVEDIHLLAQHFLLASAQQIGVKTKFLLPETIELLGQMAFPGNVRQLQSICHWLTVMVSSAQIAPKDLPRNIQQFVNTAVDEDAISATLVPESNLGSLVNVGLSLGHSNNSSWEATLAIIAKKMLEDGKAEVYQHLLGSFEKSVISAALEITRGRKVEAAERLGIGRNTITRKLQELGID